LKRIKKKKVHPDVKSSSTKIIEVVRE